MSDGVFANNAISVALVGNEPLWAYIAMLPPGKKAIGTTKERWNWLEDEVHATSLVVLQASGSGGYPGAFGVDTTGTIGT
ncbi:hypothetical protein N7471_012404 [Penicillium samsonianum]|uniref:uncharacterized protein n=1 Tax=Penicillium samsonianum TaxID=1882272 RepID=UPI002548C586|nr:uncharacterized protein N7471_012404 [Penicillium samsonianum]KAJ6125087.1 hypothetical protein N7471_012404 [Penicillium samsonianum]